MQALEDAELEQIVEILARLIEAYGQRDFDSFLALRAGDIDFARRERRDRIDELRGLCAGLGLRPAELSQDWIELLGCFWRAYYAEAPIASVRPEGTSVELHREGLGDRELAAWEREFDLRTESKPGFHLQHALVIPHRRQIEPVARDSGPLSWLDLELAFVAYDAAEGCLLARLVWDGRAEEWFLHRATTVLAGELRDERRHLVL